MNYPAKSATIYVEPGAATCHIRSYEPWWYVHAARVVQYTFAVLIILRILPGSVAARANNRIQSWLWSRFQPDFPYGGSADE